MRVVLSRGDDTRARCKLLSCVVSIYEMQPLTSVARRFSANASSLQACNCDDSAAKLTVRGACAVQVAPILFLVLVHRSLAKKSGTSQARKTRYARERHAWSLSRRITRRRGLAVASVHA